MISHVIPETRWSAQPFRPAFSGLRRDRGLTGEGDGRVRIHIHQPAGRQGSRVDPVDGFDGLYCCPTLDRQAVDAGGNRFRETIGASLANFEPFSEDHEYLSTTLIGESEILKIDQDGRVVLSDAIKAHAGIADRVTFVGQGYKFQLWEPTGKRPRTGHAISGSG